MRTPSWVAPVAGRGIDAAPVARVVVLAAVLGALVGWIARPVQPPQANAVTVTAGGNALLEVPSSWSRADRGPRIAGLAGPGTITLDSQLSRVTVGRVAAGGPSLLPSQLTRALAGRPPPADLVRVGRVSAYSYHGLLQRRPGVLFDAYAVPTTRGVLLFACSVGSQDQGMLPLAAADCEQALGSVRLTSGRLLRPHRYTAFLIALSDVIGRLAGRRAAGRSALASAAEPRAQSRAAAAVADAFAAARRTLLPLSSGLRAEASLLGELGGLAGAYRALAYAAANGDSVALADAGGAVSTGERSLTRRLSEWRGTLARS